jgi:hypothetical protein
MLRQAQHERVSFACEHLPARLELVEGRTLMDSRRMETLSDDPSDRDSKGALHLDQRLFLRARA